MECNEFLKSLNTLLEQWVKPVPLGKLSKTCCPQCVTPVFDLDIVKDAFCKKIGMSPLNSVDGVYLDKQNNTVYLLEMKDLQKYIKHQNKSDLTEQQFIEKFFTDKQTSLANKLIDSYILMLSISKDAGDFFCLVNKEKIKIIYLIIINLGSRDYEKYRIGSLAVSYSKFRFLDHTSVVLASQLDNNLSNLQRDELSS